MPDIVLNTVSRKSVQIYTEGNKIPFLLDFPASAHKMETSNSELLRESPCFHLGEEEGVYWSAKLGRKWILAHSQTSIRYAPL